MALETQLADLLGLLRIPNTQNQRLTEVQNEIAYVKALDAFMWGDREAIVKFKEAGGWIPKERICG